MKCKPPIHKYSIGTMFEHLLNEHGEVVIELKKPNKRLQKSLDEGIEI